MYDCVSVFCVVVQSPLCSIHSQAFNILDLCRCVRIFTIGYLVCALILVSFGSSLSFVGDDSLLVSFKQKHAKYIDRAFVVFI